MRTGQSLLLFLTSLSLVFSPFVADLHYRGEKDKLDALYKNVTRWGLATTLPILLALAILPGTIMRVYGPRFVVGASALEILIIGLIVPVIVGTVGFILIMVGRTGWDLLVYVASFVVAVGIAVLLAPTYGMRGAAIAEAVTLTLSAFARLLLVKRFVRHLAVRPLVPPVDPARAGGRRRHVVGARGPRGTEVADRPDALDLGRHARVRRGAALDRPQARRAGDRARPDPQAARPHAEPTRAGRRRLTARPANLPRAPGVA